MDKGTLYLSVNLINQDFFPQRDIVNYLCQSRGLLVLTCTERMLVEVPGLSIAVHLPGPNPLIPVVTGISKHRGIRGHRNI